MLLWVQKKVYIRAVGVDVGREGVEWDDLYYVLAYVLSHLHTYSTILPSVIHFKTTLKGH